ncbi:RQC-minor-1 family DNA-binding protein [Paenibacillus tarimensis]
MKNKRTKSIQSLPIDEIYAILRAADEIIAQGGRTLLSGILKGSKEKKILELGLDNNPSYGFYRNLKREEIIEKIDHMIKTDFLETEYSGKLPMIVFSPKGWLIERERRADEFLREWDEWIRRGITSVNMNYLKDRNRGMILLLLRKILFSGNKAYIPYLQHWEKIDYKKVQGAIRKVIRLLEQDIGNHPEMRLQTEQLGQELLVPSSDPVILACHECESPFVIDGTNPRDYTENGFKIPDYCPRCEMQ